ncbi:hypothetical protein [Tropicimonas sp. IMCC34011]|uniref:hypothetical protein n=1 Tax=Tropicimonas sp. IMCC34011 TaxID=2248759 RepID=UPI000E26FEB5|nr:hypothetical protein [Tropicimonas sp. IMCC34011]
MPSASFPAIHFANLDDVALPRVARARLSHPEGEAIADIPGAVRKSVRAAPRLVALPAGSSVAVAIGSRGIAAIPVIARTVIETIRGMGLEPFVVPAMGSHGGGTAEGQREVLANLGMTEDSLGAPIRATMDVVDYGTTPGGARCKFDRNAAGADGIVVVNRVKSHTTFDRPIESGLVKMVAVGLGKAEGARSVHRTGPTALSDTLPALAKVALDHAPISLGIAIVENAAKEIVALEGVAPEDFFSADERLLKHAKSLLARLPFDQIDALVVERIGKDISGAGMDFAITGRADLRSIPNPEKPFVSRIAVLGLTKSTGGNGLGIGLADFTTADTVDRIDLQQIYMNSITSTMAEKSRIPIVLPDDRAAIRATVATSWSASDPETRLCIIRSTLHLDEILVSPALAADLPSGADLGGWQDIRFDDAGRLLTRAYADEAGA